MREEDDRLRLPRGLDDDRRPVEHRLAGDRRNSLPNGRIAHGIDELGQRGALDRGGEGEPGIHPALGQRADAARAWADHQLELLLEHSGPWFVRHVQSLIAKQPPASSRQASPRRQAMSKLLLYLSDNVDRMWYRQRLAEGRAIGSGLIEGGCKTILGTRLKLNSARWVPRRAERIGNLRCLQYSDLWDTYWNKRAA